MLLVTLAPTASRILSYPSKDIAKDSSQHDVRGCACGQYEFMEIGSCPILRQSLRKRKINYIHKSGCYDIYIPQALAPLGYSHAPPTIQKSEAALVDTSPSRL